MGCFLGCFGIDKDKTLRKQRNKVIPRAQKHVCKDSPKSTTEQKIITEEEPSGLVTEAQSEEQLSLSHGKKVTFDSQVTTYEPVLVNESTVSLPETTENEGCLAKPSGSYSSSEESSVMSSVGSYPPNHRYQNCRESDDEAEEFGDSDLDDEDGDDENDSGDFDEPHSGGVVGKPFHQVSEEEVNSPSLMLAVAEPETRKAETNEYVRDRSAYIHPVLNPVENLTQWKSVKSKVAEPLKLLPQKENLTAEVEGPRASFSLEPTFNHSSSSFRRKPDQSKDQEIGVDASLSNWLVTPDSFKKAGSRVVDSVPSQGSNSVMMSFEDRPILGALTVEELKQMAISSSPRKSPCRSPDETPIIGTVGTHWNPLGSAEDYSGSAASFKGIPNSTSKYREDKRVSWHSTPFQTRLDIALAQSSTKASKV